MPDCTICCTLATTTIPIAVPNGALRSLKVKLSTHPKQQQQAKQQHKQLISQKQKEALTALTMRTCYSGKQSAEVVRKVKAPDQQNFQQWEGITSKKKKKPSNRPTQIKITNKSEALQQAETEGNTKHERQDPAPPPIYVPGITNMQRLTATMEQVVNRWKYIWK
jgi:hypothetical protein